MLKILIVDDEPLVRIGIKSTLAKCSADIEVVADVSNGLKAIEVLKTRPVDIVFTDIKMPEMDGLELIKYIHQYNRKTRIVVLSCYNDFAYVREAFTCGVSDYILKYDIDVQSIDNIIAKIISEAKLFEAAAKEGKNEDILKVNLLRNIFTGNSKIDQKEVCLQFDVLGISLRTDRMFAVVCMDIDYMQDFYEMTVQNSDTVQQEIKNVLDEFLNSFTYEMYLEANFRYVICLNMDDSNETGSLVSRFEKFQDALQKYFHFSMSIGISSAGCFCDAAKLYNEAAVTAENRFYKGCGHIEAYSKKPNAYKEYCEQLVTQKAKIIRSIGEENFPEIMILLEELKKGLRENLVPPSEAKWTYVSLLEVIKIQFHKELLEMGAEYAEQINPDVQMLGFLDDLHEYTLDIITSISFARVGSGDQREYSAGVSKSIEYINAHYSDETLNLACLSSEIGYSLGYLSRIFKKETGKYVVDYINEVRIGHAKKMLKDPKIKVYQVAENVGYANYSYFSKIFKKLTGQAPSKYDF